MGRSYFTEVAELPATYHNALEGDHAGVAALADTVHGRPTVFVGTGGTLALATLAASDHSRRTGQLSAALTPQQAVNDLAGADCAVVLFSARSRHPDIRIAAQNLQSVTGPVVLATQRRTDELPTPLVEAVDRVVTLGAGPSDGFLATNSLLAMAVAWLRGVGYDLPMQLPSLASDDPDLVSLTDRVVILYGQDQRASAVDLEARLSESGIADTQVSDLRNFAHGRHFGYGRRADGCTLVTIAGPESADLIERTLPNLASPAQHVRIRTALPYPAGTVDTLVGAMRLFGSFATADGIDPGKPHVQEGGRRLYRMTWSSPQRKPESTLAEPVRRKLRSARCAAADGVAFDLYSDALNRWIKRVAQTRVAGIVLDYDGTCCTTEGRREPPLTALQRQILTQIESGIPVGFATGRGKSILEALRAWIPSRYWQQTYVAMYSGGEIHSLDADFIAGQETHPLLHAYREQLDPYLAQLGCTVTERPTQLTFEPHAARKVAAVAALAQAVVNRDPRPGARITVSGHSVDVSLLDATKLDVADAMGVPQANVLAVGDRGDVGGNDFDLLARAGIGLSVDAVSADPDSCWNLVPAGCRGPDALTLYLGALQRDSDGLYFRWSQPEKAVVEAV